MGLAMLDRPGHQGGMEVSAPLMFAGGPRVFSCDHSRCFHKSALRSEPRALKMSS